jgi:hypothetical protein
MRVATTRVPRLPTVRAPAAPPGPVWLLGLGVALGVWSTIELGQVSGISPVILLLACTTLYLGILAGLFAVHDARGRLARTRPLDPRAEAWLRVARWAALVAGALLGAHEVTAGGDLLSSAFVIGCLVGGAVAELLFALADVAVRAIAVPRPAR